MGILDWFKGDPVAAAQAKRDEAAQALQDAETALATAQQEASAASATTGTAEVGGRRKHKKTRKHRGGRKHSKRDRTGRKSSRL